MSEQILLQGKLLGIEEFLSSPMHASAPGGEDLFTGRAQWVTLLSEVLPRALLAELGLARILLGSSGGGQFLVVLPDESRQAGGEFLAKARAEIGALSGGYLQLLWAMTENLGDWSVVRRRLAEELEQLRGAPLRSEGAAAFLPREADAGEPDVYFSEELGGKVREASSIGWSPDLPGRTLAGQGKHVWRLTPNLSADGITMARHAAPGDDPHQAATAAVLASRSEGGRLWGVLRGDVDNLGVRFRRLQTIEEHVALSVLYKQFFAGELEVLCSLPEYWRKLSILYAGGDDFAVYGSWDALISVAREIQRLFHRFAEENLKDFPGAEGKTITMAIALARQADATLPDVYDEARRNQALAKAADKDCIYVLGRILEWRHLADANDLKDTIVHMLNDARSPGRQVLTELRSIYAKPRFDKVWQFHRRLHHTLGGSREREFQRIRTHLVGEISHRRTTQLKLRPSGLVALEWARLLTEGPSA